MTQKLLWPVFYFATLFLGVGEGFFLTLSLFVEYKGANQVLTGTLFLCEGIGALLIIPFASVILRYVRVLTLVVLGVGVFTISALGFWVIPISEFWLLSIVALMAGAGFAITYAVAPVTVSRVSEPGNAVLHFAILSAVNVIGMGIAPIIAKQMLAAGVLDQMWLVSAVLSFLSGLMFFWLTRIMPATEVRHCERGGFLTECGAELRQFIRIFASEKRAPIIMVTVGGFVFTIMANFQAPFAEARGLDFSIYFTCYAASVILCRILLAKALTQMPLYLTGSIMLGVMCLALGIFQLIGNSNLLYGLTAALFGMGYGLAYPILKAQVIDGLPDASKSSALVLFTFFFFAGTYLFPFAAGWIIVQYGYTTLFAAAFALGLLELLLSLPGWLRAKPVASHKTD